MHWDWVSEMYQYLFKWDLDRSELRSFPTRRSSDLSAHPVAIAVWRLVISLAVLGTALILRRGWRAWRGLSRRELALALAARSEEHTSELQSQSNLVCRLLLEKKNNTTISS